MSNIANFSKHTGRLLPQTVKQTACFSTSSALQQPSVDQPRFSARLVEKLRVKAPTWNELSRHPFQEVDQLRPFPKGVNPITGEVGGPTGPEPTRYGDWERRGRVSDF